MRVIADVGQLKTVVKVFVGNSTDALTALGRNKGVVGVRWARGASVERTGKAGECMSEKIKYTDEPLGDLKIVPDFLPRPENLVFRDEGIKVTIALSKRSVEFLKGEARKHRTQYQRMIRRLLYAYGERHSRQTPRTCAKLARAGQRDR